MDPNKLFFFFKSPFHVESATPQQPSNLCLRKIIYKKKRIISSGTQLRVNADSTARRQVTVELTSIFSNVNVLTKSCACCTQKAVNPTRICHIYRLILFTTTSHSLANHLTYSSELDIKRGKSVKNIVFANTQRRINVTSTLLRRPNVDYTSISHHAPQKTHHLRVTQCEHTIVEFSLIESQSILQ